MDFFKSVFGGLSSLANASTLKLALILAIISALIGFVTWGYNELIETGENKCKIATQLAIDKAVKKSAKKLNDRIDKLKKEKADQKAAAFKLQDELKEARKINKGLRNEISNAKFTCDRLGAEFLRLFNATIGAEPFAVGVGY